jgi:hypothetical protein
MSILIHFKPDAATVDQYAESIRRLKTAGEWPPDGLEYHVTYGSGDNLQVSEVWDTREQFEAFGERLMPIMAGFGIEFSGAPPEIFDVVNIIKRSP